MKGKKMVTDFDKIKIEIKNNMSEYRYNHSIGVVEAIEKLVEKYGGNLEKARLVALTHDIAKEMSMDEYMSYIEKYNIDVSDIELKSSGLLHGKIGAYVVKEKYQFDDEMQNAIKLHTTGSNDMSELGKLLYIADCIENREHKVKKVQDEVEKCNTLEEAYKVCMSCKLAHVIKNKDLKEMVMTYLNEYREEENYPMKELKYFLEK